MRSVITFAIAAVTFALAASGASAGDTGSVPMSLDWDVPASCTQLGDVQSVHMEGTMRWNVDGTGAVHVTVTGRAEDDLGTTYTFSYRNNYKGDPTFTGPVHMVDHFNLVGNGPAAKLHAGFNIALEADGSERFRERGGSLTLACDPL